MRRWAPIATMAFLLLTQAESRVVAQRHVTIRSINRIPEDNIRDLIAGGRDLTEQDIRDLIQSPYAGDTISVRAVVLSSPRNSGLSEIVAGRVARVHFFVRDLAADSMGNSGMAIQVIDSEWDQHGVLELSVGQVVRLTAVVSEFQNGLFLDPISIERIGNFETFGLGPGILGADSSINVEDLNRSFGDGSFQARWEMFPRVNGSPICLDRAVIEQVKMPSPPDRVDWALTTNGESRIYTYDMSHRFRNDTRSTYPPEFNLRDDDFEPPPVGATASVCGFVVLQAFNDPDAVGRPVTSNTGSMFSLIPVDDLDLRVRELPPSVDRVARPKRVLKSSSPFAVSAFVTADPTRTITSAALTYVISGDTTTKPMLRRPGTRWLAAIPPTGVDGAFVRYWVRAVDSAGMEVSSGENQYRVFDDGINSIGDIQTTHDEGPGPSPFAELVLPIDFVGVVQSNPDRSGLFSIQDDTLLSPWSGILLDPEAAQSLLLQRGDRVRVTRARIEEIDGDTRLSELSIQKLGRVDSSLGYAAVSTSDLRQEGIAESYESMLVQFNSVQVLESLDEGEWLVTNAHLSEQVRVSNRYSDVAGDALSNWELRPFIRGLWMETGSEWMLALETGDDFGEVVNVGIVDEGSRSRGITRFAPSYPNPFARWTNLTFSLSDAGPALIEVFDVSGRRVRVLVDDYQTQGEHEVIFEASGLAAGPYIARLTSASGSDTVVIIRTD